MMRMRIITPFCLSEDKITFIRGKAYSTQKKAIIKCIK